MEGRSHCDPSDKAPTDPAPPRLAYRNAQDVAHGPRRSGGSSGTGLPMLRGDGASSSGLFPSQGEQADSVCRSHTAVGCEPLPPDRGARPDVSWSHVSRRRAGGTVAAKKKKTGDPPRAPTEIRPDPAVHLGPGGLVFRPPTAGPWFAPSGGRRAPCSGRCRRCKRAEDAGARGRACRRSGFPRGATCRSGRGTVRSCHSQPATEPQIGHRPPYGPGGPTAVLAGEGAEGCAGRCPFSPAEPSPCRPPQTRAWRAWRAALGLALDESG